MKANTQFSVRRIGLLMRNDIMANLKTIFIVIGVLYGVLLVNTMFSIGSYKAWNFHTVFFPLSLAITGYIVTSMAFSEIHDSKKGFMFMLTPASIPEKLIARLLLTSIGFSILVIVGYFIFSLLGAAITTLAFGKAFALFNPFSVGVWRSVALYLVTQSVFLFGSIYFRKASLMKTLLALFAIALGVGIITFLLIRIAFSDMFTGFFMIDKPLDLWFQEKNLSKLFNVLYVIVKLLFWTAMAPFFWIMSYVRLREKEV